MDITGLGYVGFECPDPGAWRSFGSEVLGFGLTEAPQGERDSVYLRMDDRRHRIAFHPGPVERLAYMGWEIAGRLAYEAALAKLEAEGIEVETADDALCARRGVREMTRFKDPVGYTHEIFYAQKSELRSFVPGRVHGGFAADELGLGHVVLVTPVFDHALDHFLFKVMGFEWFGGGRGEVKTGFYRPRLNPRSHCIGYAHFPGRTGIHHMGIPVRELDDVGLAYDIVLQREIPLQQTLGRHTQDPVISFYVFTPAGFPIEYFHEIGQWNRASEVNPERVSLWGHKPVGPLFGRTVRPL
jgi:2,3-dihydroxybiphenyl 1,2-dioxygenase